jgi:hypothetical protein
MAADSEPAASRQVVALRPGQVTAGLALAPAYPRRPDNALAGRLVQALGSATAAYLDLAVAFDYGFPADQVDAWLDVLVAAGADLVDVLGWAAESADLPALVGP